MIIVEDDKRKIEIELGKQKWITGRYNVREPAHAITSCVYTDTLSGHQLDILKLLPTGYTMAYTQEDVMNANPKTQEVVISTTELTPGALIAILHEIGHSHLFERWKKRDTDIKTIKRSQEERKAWGWALTKLRELRESGIDLEPNMTRTELKNSIKNHLISYEVQIASRAEFGDIKAEPEFWPPLTAQDVDDFFDRNPYFFDDMDSGDATEAVKRTFFNKRDRPT